MYETYIKQIMNPFYAINSPIKSASFEKKAQFYGRKFLTGWWSFLPERIRDLCCDMYNEHLPIVCCGETVIIAQLCEKAVPTWSEDTRWESVGKRFQRCLCAGPSCPSVGWSSPSGASSSSPSWGSSSTSTLSPWLRTSIWRRATPAWTGLGQTWTRAINKMPSIAG